MAAFNTTLEPWAQAILQSQAESNKNMDIFFVITVSMIIFCK